MARRAQTASVLVKALDWHGSKLHSTTLTSQEETPTGEVKGKQWQKHCCGPGGKCWLTECPGKTWPGMESSEELLFTGSESLAAGAAATVV